MLPKEDEIGSSPENFFHPFHFRFHRFLESIFQFPTFQPPSPPMLIHWNMAYAVLKMHFLIAQHESIPPERGGGK